MRKNLSDVRIDDKSSAIRSRSSVLDSTFQSIYTYDITKNRRMMMLYAVLHRNPDVMFQRLQEAADEMKDCCIKLNGEKNHFLL